MTLPNSVEEGARALDHLDYLVALYDSGTDEVQDEALARAISWCGSQWGSYRAGLEELARRRETAAGMDALAAEMAALRLREEAEEPGSMIRAARKRRRRMGAVETERAAVIARYGSVQAAVAPTPLEAMFVAATAHLAEADPLAPVPVADPWAPLAGWVVPWHEVPDPLAQAVMAACPLPNTVDGARAEALTWEERRREREVLAYGPGKAALPTACAARHRLVEDAWRRDLPVRSTEDFEARLDYWASRGGDDGTGYGILLLDWLRLSRLQAPAVESTKDKARRLRAENPSWSLARIGEALGISRQAVHKHLKG